MAVAPAGGRHPRSFAFKLIHLSNLPMVLDTVGLSLELRRAGGAVPPPLLATIDALDPVCRWETAYDIKDFAPGDSIVIRVTSPLRRNTLLHVGTAEFTHDMLDTREERESQIAEAREVPGKLPRATRTLYSLNDGWHFDPPPLPREPVRLSRMLPLLNGGWHFKPPPPPPNLHVSLTFSDSAKVHV